MEDEEVSERAIAESSAAMRSGDGARVSNDCGQKSGGGARLLWRRAKWR
eukprot:COSAG03_NODE_17379_length_377_cov_0.557554_2_plen_48_part_01